MIAKIAYAMAVSNKEAEQLDGPALVLPAIRGQADDIGQWVGTLSDPIRKYPGLLHRMAIAQDKERGLLLGEVQLFADSETPSYGVVIGRLKPR